MVKDVSFFHNVCEEVELFGFNSNDLKVMLYVEDRKH